MFKSPGHHPAPRKGPISFIKTAGSPRHANSTKYISPLSTDLTVDHFSRDPGRSLLSLEITL